MRRLEDAMVQLAEAQRRTEERMDQLTVRVDQLAQHMDQLTVRVDQLTQRVDQLAQRMNQLTAQVERLVEIQGRMAADLERLKGTDMERQYREKGHAYFRRLVRHPHVLSGDEINALLQQAVTRGQLSEEQGDEITLADVVVRGRRPEDGAQVYLVVEVSWGVGIDDVVRASERAALLARTGIPTVPVVAGSWVTPHAKEPAQALRVWQVTDGRVTPPEAPQ